MPKKSNYSLLILDLVWKTVYLPTLSSLTNFDAIEMAIILFQHKLKVHA